MAIKKRGKNIDYEKLYQEFFKSKHHELSPFLRDKGYLKKGEDLAKGSETMKKKTKSWALIKKLELQSVQIEAKGKAKEENLKIWKKIYGNVEQAEMEAISKLTGYIVNGYPLYSKRDKKKSQKKKKIIGYQALTFSQLNAALDKLRLIQGKAGEVVAFMGQDGESDPLRERLNILKELKELKAKKKTAK